MKQHIRSCNAGDMERAEGTMTMGIMPNTPLVRIAASGNIEYANNRRQLKMLALYTFLSDI
jgi:hypothetical protein